MFAIPAGFTLVAGGLPTLPLLADLMPLAAALTMAGLASLVGWAIHGRGATG
ncbi:MAG: hypothetical protein ACREQ9_16545 [Candidatus Binatia bacterium]